jgi:hypothetical protein
MIKSLHNTGSVLLVEDDDSSAELFTEFLRGAGHQVERAASGEAALKLLKEKRIEIVVCDIFMPGITGIKVLSRCQAQGTNIPFVFITGAFDLNLVVEAVRLGAVDFLCKPFKETELLTAVDRAMSIAQREKYIDEILIELATGVAPNTAELLQDLRRQIALLKVLGGPKLSAVSDGQEK